MVKLHICAQIIIPLHTLPFQGRRRIYDGQQNSWETWKAWSDLLSHCTFSVVDICKVLALDNLLHDVVSIHASVVYPRRVTLHGVLLPPEKQWADDGKMSGERMSDFSCFRVVFCNSIAGWGNIYHCREDAPRLYAQCNLHSSSTLQSNYTYITWALNITHHLFV